MPGWNVRVFAKHDAQYLYFDFEGVTHGGKRLFPEILLDPHNTHSAAWQKGQWWLHVSNSLCEGNGAPNVYEKIGKLQCARRKVGWDANNPPDDHTELIEIKNFIREVEGGVCAGDEDRTGFRCDRCQRQRGSEVVLLAGGRED